MKPTGKRFEIHFTCVLGYDDETKAIASASALRTAIKMIAEAERAPGGSTVRIVDRRAVSEVSGTDLVRQILDAIKQSVDEEEREIHARPVDPDAN